MVGKVVFYSAIWIGTTSLFLDTLMLCHRAGVFEPALEREATPKEQLAIVVRTFLIAGVILYTAGSAAESVNCLLAGKVLIYSAGGISLLAVATGAAIEDA